VLAPHYAGGAGGARAAEHLRRACGGWARHSGRSRAFHAASYGHLADPVAALGQLPQSRPWMDLDRVGAFGHSGGGFATVRALLDFPEVYRVGVALSGPHDARYFNLGFVEAYAGADNPAARARASNVDIADRTRASNVDIADRLRGKLLLVTANCTTRSTRTTRCETVGHQRTRASMS
jgi:pimeloyl-ACP methyl ester carboxylesterase